MTFLTLPLQTLPMGAEAWRNTAEACSPHSPCAAFLTGLPGRFEESWGTCLQPYPAHSWGLLSTTNLIFLQVLTSTGLRALTAFLQLTGLSVIVLIFIYLHTHTHTHVYTSFTYIKVHTHCIHRQQQTVPKWEEKRERKGKEGRVRHFL